MKKVLALVVVFAVALIGANSAFATIAGSKHDMTSTGTTGGFAGRHLSSCQYCHAPHNPTNQTQAPLWNRTSNSYAALTTYSFYATTTPATTVGPQSLSCLTCHDGTLSVAATTINQKGNAVTAVVGAGNVNASGQISAGNALIGPNLTNDHPVGVVFGSSGYAGLATVNAPVNGIATIGTNTVYRAYGSSSSNATVECSSCHNPHGDDYAANTVYSPFLRGSIETICSDCHTAK